MNDICNRAKYQQGWTGGLPETPCGFGSRVGQTTLQREWIPRVVELYGFKSIADIGAGDLNWIQLVEFPEGVEYTPYDLVPRHERVKPLDILADPCPQADLIMCLWVLNHMPPEVARQAWEKMRSSCKYLMYTWDCRLPDWMDVHFETEIKIREANPHSTNPHRGCFVRLSKC